MAENAGELVRRLAQGNPVDLKQLGQLEQQAEGLKLAGVEFDPSGFRVQRPLGHPTDPQRLSPVRSNVASRSTPEE